MSKTPRTPKQPAHPPPPSLIRVQSCLFVANLFFLKGLQKIGFESQSSGSITSRDPNNYLNRATVTLPPITQPYGNAGRNLATVPATFQTDVRLQKDFPIEWENSRLEFQAECFNLLNKTNFATSVRLRERFPQGSYSSRCVSHFRFAHENTFDFSDSCPLRVVNRADCTQSEGRRPFHAAH
jgi:hypothetical protein